MVAIDTQKLVFNKSRKLCNTNLIVSHIPFILAVHEISTIFQVEVIDIGCDTDHFHMIFKSKPTLEIPKYLNAIKTITSKEIRRTFPEIKTILWGDAFWSPSYFLATTGQVTLEQLKKYVENQGEK